MRGVVKKIPMIVVVIVVIAVFTGLALGLTMNPKAKPVSKFVGGTGTISKIGDYGILDSGGTEFYKADLPDNLKKVGLEVRYAGHIFGDTISIEFIEPVLLEYRPYVSHLPANIEETHWGSDH